MNPKTEEAASKLRAVRAVIEKEAAKLLKRVEQLPFEAAGRIDLDTMRALLKASEIAKKELAEVLVEDFV